MNVIYRIVGAVADHMLNRIAPLEVHGRTYLANLAPVAGANRLADAEAHVDTWEPPLADWERELRDAFYLPTDMTLDEYVGTDPTLFTEDAKPPVGAEGPAHGNAGADGSPVADEVATVIAVVLRGQGINSAPIYADLVARELRHHFDMTRRNFG